MTLPHMRASMRPAACTEPQLCNGLMKKPESFCLADVCTALHCDFFSHFVSGHVGYGFGADAPCREAVVKKHRQLCEVRRWSDLLNK